MPANKPTSLPAAAADHPVQQAQDAFSVAQTLQEDHFTFASTVADANIVNPTSDLAPLEHVASYAQSIVSEVVPELTNILSHVSDSAADHIGRAADHIGDHWLLG